MLYYALLSLPFSTRTWRDFFMGLADFGFSDGLTKHRRPWLAQAEPHAFLVEVWRSLSDWKVSHYVLMPDHVHFFAWPGSGRRDFDRWVTAWKAKFSRMVANKAFRWQARSFHHRIRSWESAEAKCRNMLNNPVRHGLVSRAEDWLYRGELFPMKDWW